MENRGVGGIDHGQIPEIAAIDRLDDIAEAYERQHGRPPSNLSHWDPGAGFVQRVRGKVRVPPLRDPLGYRFSYQLDNREALLERLGYSLETRRVIVTENGTSAVLAVAHSLALLGLRRVTVLAPCYFSARYALARLGLEVRLVHWLRRNGRFTLPELCLGPEEALWIEDPIFNTGCSGVDTLARLARILSNGNYVVADQALALPPSKLAQSLSDAPRFVGIHAPHKALCVNGLKFGAVSFDRSLYELFDHWSDVINGGLSLSAEAATEQFLSSEFPAYAAVLDKEIAEADTKLVELVAAAGDGFELDRSTQGYWRTVYVPALFASAADDLEWMANLVETTGAIFIPGSRASFDPAWGMCFRINLLRLGPGDCGSLNRLLRALGRFHRFR